MKTMFEKTIRAINFISILGLLFCLFLATAYEMFRIFLNDTLNSIGINNSLRFIWILFAIVFALFSLTQYIKTKFLFKDDD